jgi:hypothetical protein
MPPGRTLLSGLTIDLGAGDAYLTPLGNYPSRLRLVHQLSVSVLPIAEQCFDIVGHAGHRQEASESSHGQQVCQGEPPRYGDNGVGSVEERVA